MQKQNTNMLTDEEIVALLCTPDDSLEDNTSTDDKLFNLHDLQDNTVWKSDPSHTGHFGEQRTAHYPDSTENILSISYIFGIYYILLY